MIGIGPIQTTDVRSNTRDQIANAAEVIGRSTDRKKVFAAIYRGKRKVKTISEIEAITGLRHIRILQEAGRLSDNHIVTKKKIDGEMAYEKDEFFTSHKRKILKLAGNPKALAEFPTKSSPRVPGLTYVTFPVPRKLVNAKQITIDDIDSFDRVKRVKLAPDAKMVPLDENEFQAGFQKLIQEQGEFKDWGGEVDDLFSTKLKLKGQRLSVAIGFKGRGTKGKLVPAKMGKWGDQIQRLFRAPADLFIVQYWGQIDESVLEQMKTFAVARSAWEQKPVFYGIIDGQDTLRIIEAYKECFQGL